MDQIRIENLEIYAYHGVFPEEKKNGQNFYVSAVLYTDLKRAGLTDDLSETTDYGAVCKDIKRLMEEKSYDLIESAAEKIADHLLQKYSLIRTLELEIRKPSAPIGIPLDTVSVKIKRGWHKICLGLGSNLGEKRAHIEYAIRAIERDAHFRKINVSKLIETAPYGNVEQDDFLNGCLSCETTYSPEELLDITQKIEAERGRERTIHWGPRTLDLDILYYDRDIIDSNRLCIPHPEIPLRAFVLEPLAEILPYYRDPVTDLTPVQMLQMLKNEG